MIEHRLLAVVGRWLGDSPLGLRRPIASYRHPAAYTVQIMLVIGLGVLVFPTRLAPVALLGFAVAAILVFVARRRVSLREQVFRERGPLRAPRRAVEARR
jgi:NhaP-type Na+/H+ and K+/H+ antiporter